MERGGILPDKKAPRFFALRAPGADRLLGYDGPRVTSRIVYSFPEFVAAQKGAAAARLREGAAYAFSGDLNVRRTLERLKPVQLAREACLRHWLGSGRQELLRQGETVGGGNLRRIDGLLTRAATVLAITRPAAVVTPALGPLEVRVLGTTEMPVVALGPSVAERLSDDELLAVLGSACGHVQNEHPPYLTTLYLLAEAQNLVVRWAVAPAVLGLRRWARRADVTADRAGALVTRSLAPNLSAIVKRTLGQRRLLSEVDVEKTLADLRTRSTRPPQSFDAPASDADEVDLATRVRALELFAETTYFRSVMGISPTAAAPGITKEACDRKVAELFWELG